MQSILDDLDMCDVAHVDWVKAQNNPELWHVAAIAILVYLGDPQKFLLWLVEQPSMDRATAGYVFLGRGGARYLEGRAQLGGEGLSGADLLEVLDAICNRSDMKGFTRDLIGLHPGFESERKACLDAIQEGRVAANVVIPAAVIGLPFSAEAQTAYFVEDGAILRR